jgi:4-carboxymuconolactone decarboxylase
MMSAATAPLKGPARLGSVGPFGPPVRLLARYGRVFHPIWAMEPAPEPDAMGLDGERDVYMGQTARFQETLRRLALIDESCVEDQAGLALGPAEGSSLDPKTEALLRVGATAAIGASPVCLEWSTGRALAAGASEDEIADVLLAIAPVVGLGRIVSAAPGVAIALGYDTQATRQEPDEATRQEPEDHEPPGERGSDDAGGGRGGRLG